MNVGSSTTPNEHAVVYWDCLEISQKSKDDLELVRHNRMLRSHCLESELDMNYAFKDNETIVKTCLRVSKKQHFGSQVNPLGALWHAWAQSIEKSSTYHFLGHHLESFWTHENRLNLT